MVVCQFSGFDCVREYTASAAAAVYILSENAPVTRNSFRIDYAKQSPAQVLQTRMWFIWHLS